jgi:hypothetical protein
MGLKTYEITAENEVDREQVVIVAYTSREALKMARRRLYLSKRDGRVRWRVERQGDVRREVR